MANASRTGIFWGDRCIALAVVDKTGILRCERLFYDDVDVEAGPGEDISDDIRCMATLRQLFSNDEKTPKELALSLPLKDLIFRSFDIPFMTPDEVRSVVDFEATKYIPIDLEQLAYTYHMIPHTEDGQRKLRVLFVAVRRSVLQQYGEFAEKFDLSFGSVEPSAVSIGRVLRNHKLLAAKGEIAVVFLRDNASEIMIFDSDVLVFVRALDGLDATANAEEIKSALQNDITVSLNFYKRQNPNDNVRQVLIVSEKQLPEDIDAISSETGVPVSAVNSEIFLGEFASAGLDGVRAFGAGLSTGKYSSKNFDLSEAAIELQRSGYDPAEQVKAVGVLLACIGIAAAILIGVVFWTGRTLANFEQQKKAHEKSLGKYWSLKQEDIRNMHTEMTTKLDTYQGVSTDSRISVVIWRIAEVLPDSAWIKGATFTDNGKTLKAQISGYVYSEDENSQFSLVNDVVTALRNDETLSQLFPNIKNESTQKTRIGNFPVTQFSLVCGG